MNKQVNPCRILSVIMFLLMLQSCGKTWLEAKPDKSLVVPQTIKEFQSLLDNSTLFNANQSCGLGEIGAGDFYISSTTWQSLFSSQEKSAYIWGPTASFYNAEVSGDWENAYKRILNANVILAGILKIKPGSVEQQDWNNVKGAALFFRAFDFFNLAQEFCVAYHPNTSNSDLGLPLRLEYDVNIRLKRSTLQQTYERIISDLEEAVSLLGTKPLFKTRPSKEAAYALLARVYLSMEDYEKAGLYAGLTLDLQAELIDYSKLNTAAAFPLARFNTEVIFQSSFTYGIFNATRLTLVPELYDEYAIADLRRLAFFTTNANGMTFKGSYNGDKNLFGGLATDEVYLIRAEANARKGELVTALADLNLLRRSRWSGVYLDIEDTDPNRVLGYILKERRRELVFRGLRWTDLRRLNRDNRFAIALTRVLNGQDYVLQPEDKRYVLPIDEEEIRLSGIQQNER